MPSDTMPDTLADSLVEALGRSDDDRTIHDWNMIDAAARLAPELYAALEAMCREFTYGNPDQREAISRARDALDKARGDV